MGIREPEIPLVADVSRGKVNEIVGIIRTHVANNYK